MVYTLGDIVGNKDEIERRKQDHFDFNTKVAMPGIVISFDAEQQTVNVQPAIREKMKDQKGNLSWTQLPPLPDLPLVLPKAGNFVLTMPVKEGDEVLVIFADSCVDSWWASGGIQNWNDKRRHDLSDGFAILGTWSQPNKIPNYSSNSAQLRNLAGTSYIEVTDSGINIVGNINNTGTITSSGNIIAPNIIVNNKSVDGHAHSDPAGTAAGTTGAF